MKYMLWKDLEPGDVLQFTDEYLNGCNHYYKQDLIINSINVFSYYILIGFINGKNFIITYSGAGFYFMGTIFKLIKLKEE